MPEQQEHNDKKKTTTEKIWDSTRKTLHKAGFQAGKYRRLVQKKVDLASVHRKIATTHGDLGKEIDELREHATGNILETQRVQNLLDRLDELKTEAAELEADIEKIKQEEPQEEEAGQETDPS